MKKFHPELDDKERLIILQDTAVKVEDAQYQKQLTFDELALRNEQLATNCILLSQKEDELNQIKLVYKTETDPVKLHNKTILTEIKTKQTTVKGLLYHIANYDENMMEVYDHNFELVESRRLRPDEKQPNVFHMAKTAN